MRSKLSPAIPQEFYESLFSNSVITIDRAKLRFSRPDQQLNLINQALESRDSLHGLTHEQSAALLLLLKYEELGEQTSKELRAQVLSSARKLRKNLYGNDVAIMVPIEFSSFCASNCKFCGWRSDNKEMVRLKISDTTFIEQIEQLAQYGFSHYEIVAGDDLAFIKNDLKSAIRLLKKKLTELGSTARISICLTPLHETHYKDLKSEGLNTVLTWQETYNPELYKKLVTAGPKSHGITEDFKVNPKADGRLTRIQSQELAVRAGLQVGLGVMLGLDEDHPEADILSAISHAHKLIEHYQDTIQPIIIGMPTWNPITTAKTDNIKHHKTKIQAERDFELISAIYLLSLPDRLSWVFPNCRVSKATQINSIQTAGCFTSGMVRVGPGAYLNYDEKKDLAQFFARSSLSKQPLTKDTVLTGEQFTHHFDTQENYLKRFQAAGLQVVQEHKFLSDLASERASRKNQKAS